MAVEQNLDLLGKKKNYVEYMARRPRVEAVGVHGLFTDAGVPVVLSKVAEEVSCHTGNVWTNVISLHRADATRLGYDNAKAWQDLICSQRNNIAEQMKIKPANLRWYAAYHNENHHPHVHLIAYSTDPKEAYVTKQGIENIRSSLAKEIFQQDLLQIYTEQTVRRDALNELGREAIQEKITQIMNGVCDNVNIEELITHLAYRLKNTSGKKQYGYLKAPLKTIVNQIVDELEKDQRISELYSSWYEMRNEVLSTYADKLPPRLPLSQQKEFKSIKNMVIAEALKIGGQYLNNEPDIGENKNIIDEAEVDAGEMDEAYAEIAESIDKQEILPHDELIVDACEEIPACEYQNEELPSMETVNESRPDNSGQSKVHIAWSDRYKEARTFLYGSGDIEQDFAEAYRLFMEEVEEGNVLAMYDLGRMFMDGLGMEIDVPATQEWYKKALDAFLEIETKKSSPYVQYRIGKMYNAGLGTAQDYLEAADWFHMAAKKNYKYAQYSLAGLYYQGYGVDQSYEKAFDLYGKSARQNNPYAAYELAKMYRDGLGTEKKQDKANQHFESAFTGFVALEADSHDDKLQYRLGQMLYTGTGTEQDITAATEYFEKSAKTGNVNAQYMLGKIYLESSAGDESIEKAISWLTRAAENGNSLALYALGKLYRDGNHVNKDIQKAITYFTQSAEKQNQYAAYALGKLYLSGEDMPRDVNVAIKWFTLSAELGNQFAQYSLAKLYLGGDEIPEDIPKALELLKKSALQNNQHAQYKLGKLYLTGDKVPKDIRTAIRWLTSSAEQGNQYAQYTLGKLFLMGHDVPCDRETAVKWLTASAAQGNIYARFFLDNLDSFRNPSALHAATRLMHHLGRIFNDEQKNYDNRIVMTIDRKLRKKLMQKKSAQGHAYDDYVPQQNN